MGVPAHDTRDFAYAKKYDLPIRTVIAPPGWGGEDLVEAYTGPGEMVNSGEFVGLGNEEGKQAVTQALDEQGIGGGTVSYRIRDWLISRQRYWGAPIPMVYCDACGIVPIPEDQLPVLLPEDAEFRPTGESPLTFHEEFVNTTCPECGGPARRETDTMDTFMCSSWYFLKYASPNSGDSAFRPEEIKHWLPVDQYTGGAEHAVMHLLYARFFVKALRDIGLLDFDEPFVRLYNQGIIISDRQKMSKSRGNVITPDEYVDTVGADVVRGYLMFIGPWDQGGEWVDQGINGIVRWYNRVWDLVERYEPELGPGKSSKQTIHMLHKTTKKVYQDLDRFHFNTALASLMEFTNHLARALEEGSVDGETWRESIRALLLMLAPTAPHLAEELWAAKGYEYSIHNQPFPQWDDALAAEEEVTLVLQVNGKVRDRVTVSAGITEEEAKKIALSSERIRAFMKNGPRKVVYVPGRLVNIVA